MTEDEMNPLMTAVELLAMARGISFDAWLREAIQAQANKDVMQFTILGLPFVSEARSHKRHCRSRQGGRLRSSHDLRAEALKENEMAIDLLAGSSGDRMQ